PEDGLRRDFKAGSESQDSDEPVPPGITKADFNKPGVGTPTTSTPKPVASTIGFKLVPSQKGVENAKKRLRAFSIQKKSPIAPVPVPKAISGGSTTVFIGKLNHVKTTPKVEKSDDAEQKKPPKPPKPGQARKVMQDSYTELQKRTLHEIEDMKRKMELVDLGIPLGLICPSATNDKAMPTKAMPPIKTFLVCIRSLEENDGIFNKSNVFSKFTDPSKLDEIIREAKKAKAEGREFKFDYQKILPDYDNPFQRKKDEMEKVRKISEDRDRDIRKKLDKERDKGRRRSDKYDKDSRRHSSHRKDDRDKRRDDKDKHRERDRDKSRERTEERKDDKKDERKEERKDEKKDKEQTPVSKKKSEKPNEKDPKETDVNLSEYLVCDSWSLDNEDRSNLSPKPDDKLKNIPIPKEIKPKETTEAIKDTTDSPKTVPAKKIEKLQPVIDSFKFEIDPNDDELLDMFDESCDIEKFATKTRKKDDMFDSPIDMKIFDFDQSKGSDALTDDTFLESVINEIKQEDMSDEDSQDKGLVEYDSPSKESQSSRADRISITPELDERMFVNLQSSRSDYSDGYRSTESGYKSTESGYKSNASSKGDSYRGSVEKELVGNFNRFTVDSLETWSFVLKICQPLLFRHDNTKCFRYTRTMPKVWYSEKTKICPCVKDRGIVYNELEMCKMNLVDRVYGCDQIPEAELPKARTWYPRFANCLSETSTLTPIVPASDWEADDSQNETALVKDKRRSNTPQRSEEVYLDREYQRKFNKSLYSTIRFMEAVWPDVAESKAGTPRSTTPDSSKAKLKLAKRRRLSNNIHIKKEVDETSRQEAVKMADMELEEKEFATESEPVVEPVVPEVTEVHEIKEEISFQEIPLPAPKQTEKKDTEQIADKHTDTTISTHEEVIEPSTPTDLYDPTKPDTSTSPTDKVQESNLSQSSQESTTSKDVPYEKDDSHLRPSSQNSNYSFNDVINASQQYQKDEEDKFQEYEQGNYEMYEQLAMAYQSDVAKQSAPSTETDPFFASQRIETVVRARSRGEIKCDWRAGDEPSTPVPTNNQRPSRWGLKPGQVNIVLTGGDDYTPRNEEPVYQIQTIANRSENNSSGSYDEAYEDMYGASDRLQYGDCFNTDVEPQPAEESKEPKHKSSLDDRIDQALRTTVLGEVAKDADETDGDKDGPEKGILVTKAVPESRGAKRVSFADGYKPGQDSDVEEPPVKKKKKSRRYGCAWPCPATHNDHVPLWDALPPPPPPPGSPPPNIRLAMQMMAQAPMLQQQNMMHQATNMMQQPPNMLQQPPNMLQQPPGMLQQPPNMMQQPPNMMQQPPNMLPQPPLLQQPPQMLQQPPQLLQQPPQMLQQPGVKPMMSTPFPLPSKLVELRSML
ncbi:hypothetical protein HW555_005240, partial [Spodoptera exigua]